VKKVLIIAYYFPPMGMGGVQRAFKFAKYLPSFGWQPIVLTVKEVNYFAKDHTLLEELPSDTKIIRTGSLDPLRVSHLLRKGKSLKGETYTTKKARFQSWMFFPDNKIGWIPFALSKGLKICKREKIDLIFSTSPPPSAHLAGYLLKKLTGKAWVADFRDLWIGFQYENYPTFLHRKLKENLEKSIIVNADAIITVSPGMSQRIRQFNLQAKKVQTITNGFDQEDFKTDYVKTENVFTILHSGTFSLDHNPIPFLIALENLLKRNAIDSEKIKFVHCGLSLGIDLEKLIEKRRLRRIFFPLGYLSHSQTIKQLKGADLLLLTTASHPQAEFATTGKLFEYLAAKKPILAIVPKESFAARIVQLTESGTVIAPQEIGKIEEVILSHYRRYYENKIDFQTDEEAISQFERKHLASKLVSLFNQVLKNNP